MSRTIKTTTAKHFHDDGRDQLHTHLPGSMAAGNFARRLKTPGALTPCEQVFRTDQEPDRLILNPIHKMPGLNTLRDSSGSFRRQAARCDVRARPRDMPASKQVRAIATVIGDAAFRIAVSPAPQ